MKPIANMTLEQRCWLCMFIDDEHCHLDPWTHPTVPVSNWIDTLAHRIADAAGGHAKKNFDPAKTFTPDPKLLAKYPGCLKWSENPSFPPKVWNQMAMSWPYGKPWDGLEDYLRQMLKIGSFVIKRHQNYNLTLKSTRLSSSNISTKIADIASKPNDWWVIFDPVEAWTVENAFKNKIFQNWCKLTSIGDDDFAIGMWGTFPLFGFPSFGANFFPGLNGSDCLQILAQGFLYAFYG